MVISSLNKVISSDFFSRLVSETQGEASTADSLKAAFSGQSSDVSLSSSLNLGSRIYTSAARSLNQAISAVQISKDSLTKLSDISGRLVEIVDRASKPTISTQERNGLDAEFHKLGREFQDIVEETDLGDREIFQSGGLTEVLTLVGLDPETSESIGEIFDDFLFSDRDDDQKLASEEIRGERPVSRPTVDSATLANSRVTVGQIRELDDVFNSDRSLRVLSDVAVLKEDIGALDDQIKSNLETIGKLENTMIENYGLVRAVAISMQNLQNQITSTTQADELAKMLRNAIRNNADSAMRAQAGNLDAIAVAAYTLSQEAEDN